MIKEKSLVYTEYPYFPPVKGLFHNQRPKDTSILGEYTVYIPDNFEHCSPAVLILPTDYTNAQSFWEGNRGQEWKSVADGKGVAIVIAEAYQGKQWNLGNSISMRDDEAYLYAIIDTIRQKYSSIPAVFNLDERSLYIVGYEKGGIAAHKMSMLFPQLFGGLVSIDGSEVPETIMETYGDKLAFPFIAGQNSDGRETIGLKNKKIPLPVWIISSSKTAVNNETVKNYWIAAAEALQDVANEYAQTTYKNGAVRVWVSVGRTINAKVIYDNFLVDVLRYTNIPGGVLNWRVKIENSNGKGFFLTETTVDGFLRRWLTYIPKSYNTEKEYPLIIAMHGGSNSAEAFVGDSRWQEAAEKYGLLVVFPQAYPCKLPWLDWIPVPSWNQYIISPSNPPDDVAFIKEVINATKKNYNVDEGRIYATGHSNGAGMTWRLGLDIPDMFAAIAPAGWTVSAIPGNHNIEPSTTPLPVWLFMGEYDQMGADRFKKGNPNDTCLKYWAERNGFDYTQLTTEYDSTGRFYTRNWTNGKDNIPLFRFTSVAECPHIYVPDECILLWEDYFSKIVLNRNNGKRYYDGQAIIKGNR